MLENCICEVRVDVCEGNTDHFVSLFMLWDLIDQPVSEALSEGGKLFLIESQQEGEEDVGQVDVQLSLLSFRALQTDRHGLQIAQHHRQRVLDKGLNLGQVHLLIIQIHE